MKLEMAMGAVTKTPRLNSGEKIFLLYLMTIIQEDGEGIAKYPAHKLAKRCQMSPRSIQRIVASLKKKGFINVESTSPFGNKWNGCNIYTIRNL